MTKTIEFGTHRVATVDSDGNRCIKRFQQPLSWGQFFGDYARRQRSSEVLRGWTEVADAIDQLLEEQKPFAETGVQPRLAPLAPQPGAEACKVLQNPLFQSEGANPGRKSKVSRLFPALLRLEQSKAAAALVKATALCCRRGNPTSTVG